MAESIGPALRALRRTTDPLFFRDFVEVVHVTGFSRGVNTGRSLATVAVMTLPLRPVKRLPRVRQVR